MFTRCPQCGTVFRITATQLRIAGGDVRCGSCAQVFNALGQLTDEPPALPDSAPAQSVAPPGEDAVAGLDTNPPVDDDTAMEFDAPEPTWSKYFLAPKAPPPAAASAGKPAADVALDGELESITADPDEWRAFLEEMEAAQPGAAPWNSDELNGEADELGREAPLYVIDELPDDTRHSEAPGHDGPGPAADDAGEDLAPAEPADQRPEEAGFAQLDDALHEPYLPPDFSDDTPAPDELEATSLEAWADADGLRAGRQPRSGLWALGCLLLLALLATQFLHGARDELASHPRYGATVRELYSRLGRELFPSWPLDAYTVRRAEALAGGTSADALDITAAIETRGEAPLGLPLVRIALRDQWANVVASRVFTPDQYLPEALPGVVPGGTQIPVRLSVADPGTQARGFEVDLCLPRRQGLECQLARDPFAP